MASAGALTQSALLECDPADQGVRTPLEVYSTPVFMKDISSNDRVAVWVERNLVTTALAGDTEGYYFVRFDVPTGLGLPTCTIKTEEDFAPSGSTELPSPTFVGGEGDGSSSTPMIDQGARKLYFPTLMGWVNSYEFDSDAWPGTAAGFSHYSSEVTHADADAGTDTSGFVDPTRKIMVFATRCSALGGADCDVDVATPGSEREWGRVFLTDLSSPSAATPLNSLDIEAWTFGAPVGVIDNRGPNMDELLVALGTYESVDGSTGYEFNTDYDCSVLLLSVDSTSTVMTIGDTYPDPAGTDPDPTTCVPPDDGAGGYYTLAVDGFGGEPIPYNNGTRLLALRYFGKLYSLNVAPVAKTLSKEWAVVLEDSNGSEFRQPAEHSPVFVTYPGTQKRSVLWGANVYSLEEAAGVIVDETFEKSVVLEVELDALNQAIAAGTAGCDAELNCPLDVDAPPSWAKLVAELPAAGASFSGPLVWSPGAAGNYQHKSAENASLLVYALATGANTVTPDNADEYCDTAAGDVPPQLHLFYRDPGWTTWQHDTVDLTEDTASPVCYEPIDDDPTDTAGPQYRRIQVPGGVSVRGADLYVATGDGRFWMYGTVQATQDPTDPSSYLMAGAADGWPMFRKDFMGTARGY